MKKWFPEINKNGVVENQTKNVKQNSSWISMNQTKSTRNILVNIEMESLVIYRVSKTTTKTLHIADGMTASDIGTLL